MYCSLAPIVMGRNSISFSLQNVTPQTASFLKAIIGDPLSFDTV